MASAWTVLKWILKLFLITLLISIIHLVLTAPGMIKLGQQIYNSTKDFSPELADILLKTYVVIRNITGYVYQAYKAVIDWLYEHIT